MNNEISTISSPAQSQNATGLSYPSDWIECVVYQVPASQMPRRAMGYSPTEYDEAAKQAGQTKNPYTVMLMMPYRVGRSPMVLLEEPKSSKPNVRCLAWEAADGVYEHVEVEPEIYEAMQEQIQQDGLVIGFVPDDEQGIIYDKLMMAEALYALLEQQGAL